MQVNKKELEKSQIELLVTIDNEEFSSYFEKAARRLSEQVKIEGFRPGKAPLEVVKQKIGEMSILEEAARLAINKTVDQAIEENSKRQAIGQPQISITKLAPNNPLEYKVVFSLIPEITLGKYKDLSLKKEEAAVDDQEVDKMIEDLRDMRAREESVERPAETGDKVLLDINLSLDKVPVENGQYKDLSLILGKDYFIPGFDAKINGAKKETEISFSLEYPKDHFQKNLAGKNVDFRVKIKDVQARLKPALDGEFAAAFGLKDIEELKSNIKENLLHDKKHKLEAKEEAELLTKIVDNSKFGEFPDELVDGETRNMLAELEQSVIRQGGRFEDYLNHLKKTKEELLLEMTPNAVKRVKSALAIREIAIKEEIKISEEELSSKLEELKKRYENSEKVKHLFEEDGYRRHLENVMTNEKVIAKLKEWNYAPTSGKQKG